MSQQLVQSVTLWKWMILFNPCTSRQKLEKISHHWALSLCFFAKRPENNATQSDSPAASQIALISINESNVDLTTPLDIGDILAAHRQSPLTPAFSAPYMYDYGTDLIGPILIRRFKRTQTSTLISIHYHLSLKTLF